MVLNGFNDVHWAACRLAGSGRREADSCHPINQAASAVHDPIVLRNLGLKFS